MGSSAITDFYPRPPRGGRPLCAATSRPAGYFYPRPPRGGRRSGSRCSRFSHRFLSTPSARRATHCWAKIVLNHVISIHALREEGDAGTVAKTLGVVDFYPRPPRGGRPRSRDGTTTACDFYPRPPRGGRPMCAMSTLTVLYFYPRPPRGGRRQAVRHPCYDLRISIHALREEGDRAFRVCLRTDRYFYPRPPRGGRPR